MIDRRLNGARVRDGYRALLLRVMLLALAAYLIFTFAFLITQNHGLGMYPAMKDGDLCIVFRRQAQHLMGQEFAADDIVSYRVEGKRYMGRVVAIAGDSVLMNEGGSLSVNGVGEGGGIMYPTYARGELTYPLTVPQGCVFVLGDHRTDTVDSRDFGPISLDSVEGKVITILRRRGL